MREPASGVNRGKSVEIAVDTPMPSRLPFAIMKKLLSLLMCFVFLQAETFALRGGPNGGQSLQIAGAYSGVMIDVTAGGGSDLGLFLLTAITNGASNGQVVIFTQTTGGTSDTFSGLLTGLTNPTTAVGTFTGVFGGTGQQNNAGSRTVTISGRMAVVAVKTGVGNRLRGLFGTASSQTLTTVIAGNNIVLITGAAKTYNVSGWQTNTTGAQTAGFAIATGN